MVKDGVKVLSNFKIDLPMLAAGNMMFQMDLERIITNLVIPIKVIFLMENLKVKEFIYIKMVQNMKDNG